MTIVKLHRQNKNKIKEYGNGTFDEIVSSLIDDVEDIMPIVDIDESSQSTVKLERDTIDRLRAYALTSSESLENILIRMLITSHNL